MSLVSWLLNRSSLKMEAKKHYVTQVQDRRGGKRCAAIHCCNVEGGNVKLFRFPKHAARCIEWVNNSHLYGLNSLQPVKLYNNYRLCSEHFENNQFHSDMKDRLLRDAVPTIFNSPAESPLGGPTTSNQDFSGFEEQDFIKADIRAKMTEHVVAALPENRENTNPHWKKRKSDGMVHSTLEKTGSECIEDFMEWGSAEDQPEFRRTENFDSSSTDSSQAGTSSVQETQRIEHLKSKLKMTKLKLKRTRRELALLKHEWKDKDKIDLAIEILSEFLSQEQLSLVKTCCQPRK